MMRPMVLLRTVFGKPFTEVGSKLFASLGVDPDQSIHIAEINHPSPPQVQDLVANGHADAPIEIAFDAKSSKGQILDREIVGFVVGRGDPTYEIGIVGVINLVHFSTQSVALASVLCIQAACFGARLVLAHSLSMSHLHSSSFLYMSGVPVFTASSKRCPLGSKK